MEKNISARSRFYSQTEIYYRSVRKIRENGLTYKICD